MAVIIKVVGLLKDVPFHRCKLAADLLYQNSPGNFMSPENMGLLDFQWSEFLRKMHHEHDTLVSTFEGVVVFVNNVVLGSCEEFLSWAKERYGYVDMRPLPFYYSLAKDSYNSYILNKDQLFVYMDISVEGEPYGRLVFELFKSICPKTCENFKHLCTGEKGESENGFPLSYKNSFIHRIVPNGWIQGGDILGGSGGCSVSSDDNLFPDECFAVEHDCPGILGMVNQGPNTNGSQFYITLQPAPWMDKQYVAFGRLVEGSKALTKLKGLETYNERPVKDAIVRDCGVVQPLEVLSMS